VETIFDVGMYDGEDTAYYLEIGYRVVAVEPNALLIERARSRFAHEIAAGRLDLVSAAITPTGEPAKLMLSGAFPGSNSLFADRVAHREPIGEVTVPGTTLPSLFARYGVPRYLKVDIEGADRFCVLALDRDVPPYLSFELGEDVGELHAHRVGYSRFKAIHQNTFRRADRTEPFTDRVIRKLASTMGYRDPRLIRRAGRFFVAGHSSGPVPWKSDGPWRTIDEIQKLVGSMLPDGWIDIHAAI
jgi:FkbM family methyltransferase